jgi:hypothetical protein
VLFILVATGVLSPEQGADGGGLSSH